MKNKSFAGRLSLKIILITSGIFLLALMLIAFKECRVARKSAIDYSNQLLLTSCTGIEGILDAVESSTNSVSRTLEAFNHNGRQLDTAHYFQLMEDMLSNNPQILGCGIYFEPYTYVKNSRVAGVYVSKDPESGRIDYEWDDDISYADDGWDYFNENWYKDAIESGEPLWIPPFIEYMVTTEYRYMTSYSVPLKDKNGKAYGACAFDVSLDWLQEELLSMRPYPHSNVILLDREGNYICNPLSDKPYEGSIYDSHLLKNNDPSEDILTALKEDKVRGMSCVARSLENGWVMAIFNHPNEVFAEVKRIQMMLVVIAILGMALLFRMSKRIIHKEAHPLVEFAEAAGKITDGRFDVPIPKVKTEDEISELGNALTYMQASVTNYIEKLTLTTSEKERLASELNVAKKIQMQMLSTEFPTMEGSGIFATSIAARQVGGDLYDLVVKDDNLHFIVADVSGKGVPAALLMAISISAFRASSYDGMPMNEIVRIVNRVFQQSNKDMMFITAVAGRINRNTGVMDICNAGHNPLVLITPEGEASFLHFKSNLACGLMKDFPYVQESMTLAKGSRIIIYTDGVTEAEDIDHNQFGDDRLLDFARQHSTSQVQSDEQVVSDLKSAVGEFVGDAEQFDDITIMSISI